MRQKKFWRVSPEEYKLLQRLRERKPANNPPNLPITIGDRLADMVADTVGSWRFVIIQTTILSRKNRSSRCEI